MLESFRNILLHGSWVWPIGLIMLAVSLLRSKDSGAPGTDPMGRTINAGLRVGTLLTLGGLVALVLASTAAGPWLVFVIFPVAYATPPVFMLTTALGLIIGIWKNRRDFIGRQLTKIFVAIMVLIVVGTAWLVLALHWLDTPI